MYLYFCISVAYSGDIALTQSDIAIAKLKYLQGGGKDDDIHELQVEDSRAEISEPYNFDAYESNGNSFSPRRHHRRKNKLRRRFNKRKRKKRCLR